MQPRTVKQTTRRVRSKPSIMTPRRLSAAVVTEIEATAENVVRLSFATRVQSAKLPGYTAGADGSATVASMAQVGDRVIELSFTGDVAGTDLFVQGGDPGIRTASGGFVPAGSYAIPSFP